MNYFEGEKIQVATTSGSTRIGERYVISLKIAGEYGFVNEAKVVMNQQKGTNEREIKMDYVSTENYINLFTCEIPFENIGIHYFCIRLIINGQENWIKYDKKNNRACMTYKNMPYWTVTVYDKDFCVPEWVKGKIMYQIFPDRFYRSENYTPEAIKGRITKPWGELPNWEKGEDGEIHNNDFFMGNIKGIEEKLDYLQELGVEIIYLNPISLSQSNHRYDTADYKMVDPYLGTNEDFKHLCESAHERGMKVILDAVFNHTGNDSKYFNEFGNFDTVGAFQSKQSPFYAWYKKDQNGNFKYWWNIFRNLPECDGNNPGWQNFIYGEDGVVDFWLSLGADGIRLDVADELTDEFIANLRNRAKSKNKDCFILGEVWDNAITKEKDEKQRTYLLGKGLDSVMNYPFTNAILKYIRFGRADYLKETLNEILTQYPKDAVDSLMNSLSTHDISRAMTTLVSDGIQDNRFNWVWDVPYSRDLQLKKEKLDDATYDRAKQLLKLATAIQYFLPGNPCIYYGDEIGMYGYRDPFNRRCFKWDDIDDELHSFFVKLGKIRKETTFLASAEINVLRADKDIFAFERISVGNSDERLLIVVNRSEKNVRIDIPDTYQNGLTLLSIHASDGVLSKYGIIIKSSK